MIGEGMRMNAGLGWDCDRNSKVMGLEDKVKEV